MKRALPVLVLLAVAAPVAWWLAARDPGPALAPAAGDPAARTPAAVPSPPPEGGLRWVAAGGGVDPASTQVSIEQDLALARRVLGPGGRLLFAGGPGSRAVQVARGEEAGDPVMLELAGLFAPRAGRDAVYRETDIAPDGPATLDATLDAIEEALAAAGGPLTVLLAGHGEPGEAPADVAVLFWGHGGLGPQELAGVLDQRGAGREVRLVVTTCFSGAFADVAFRGAEPLGGAAPTPRCGLFATTWDREASGCDPDPRRGVQDGFALHFLQALAGRDRDGEPLPAGALDLDGDGAVSLLEAHARARVASRSVEVPTTTSERWLRHAAGGEGPEPARAGEADPVEGAVIAALAARLGVAADPAAVARRDEALALAVARAREAWRRAEDAEADAYDAVAAALLARWPVLDDPWHPDFPPMFTSARRDLVAFMESDPRYLAWADAADAVAAAEAEVHRLERERAPWLRLRRALENVDLAARLEARGGEAWEVYRRLRRCEAGRP